MLESSIGMFTVVDLNHALPSYFWRGEKLSNVSSCLAMNTSSQRRVTLRVLDPAAVAPALSAAEVSRLNAVYAAMQAGGIIILKTRGD